MPFAPSKIRTGTLTLAVGAATPVDFAVPVSSVKITPSYDEEGDRIRFVNGTELAPDTTRSDVLALSFVQDFEDSAGLVHYLWTEDLNEAAFVWTTGTAGEGGMQWSGVVQVRACEVGGENNVNLTSELELPIIGDVTGPTAVV